MGGDDGGGGAHAINLDDQIERHRIERQRVAERDEIGGALRRHDTGDARHGEHIALGNGLIADGGKRGSIDGDMPLGHGFAPGCRLGRDIDHAGGALVVEMGERHAASPSRWRVAAVTSAWRMSDSPTRKVLMPAACNAVRSPGPDRPLSATSVRPGVVESSNEV